MIRAGDAASRDGFRPRAKPPASGVFLWTRLFEKNISIAQKKATRVLDRLFIVAIGHASRAEGHVEHVYALQSFSAPALLSHLTSSNHPYAPPKHTTRDLVFCRSST